MNGQERRNAIIERLKGSTSPISAKSLADEHSVTRQIIVADIALLRAGGYRITAVSRGYLLEMADEGLIRHVAVKHGMEAIADEFYAVVDNGGKVLDISVEHSLYGSISAELNITSRYEADQFVKKAEETGATPLSLVTEGIHIHTIAVKDEEAFSRIVARLSELGILVETN
jgi:transcriptional regulator of NAD metabolism